MTKVKTFVQGIREALTEAMEKDSSVLCYGLGVTDPKGIFGTTLGLEEKFGSDRVFDMPTSENAMTGVAIGAALNGLRPVMVHQRLDFFLLALDQLVNNAAKWFYMFGGQKSVPITIRLITGMGWGQGPTHSQSLHSWFAHIPGIKVVMPSTPADAKGLLLASIFDNNPVIFIEHRWLHNTGGNIPDGYYSVPLGKSHLMRRGKDLTIVSFSYMTIEALRAIEFLEKRGITCDLIDLRTIKPIDLDPAFSSVKETGRLLALDSGNEFCSVASEVIAQVALECFNSLRMPPQRLALPDIPLPTSPALTQNFYNQAKEIVETVGRMLNKDFDTSSLEQRNHPHDVPGDWFKGPF